MNYVKKMCILRQIKQGFSGDGKTLSGLIKIEQYGKNLAVEISIINFAPLVSGEYYCLLSDGKGKTEMLSLRGKSIFNILSDLDISSGFCGIICYVKNEVVPIAYGINGNGSYDWKKILNATLPPVFPQKQQTSPRQEIADSEQAHTTDPISIAKTENQPTRYEANTDIPLAKTIPIVEARVDYNDESVATENYFEEKKNECVESTEVNKNARIESGAEKPCSKAGTSATKNGDATRVLHPFATAPDGYYWSVKREIDELFATYPRDKTLNGAFSCSEWVRVKGTAKAPQYLVGVLYTENKAQYLCYAIAAESKDNPPPELCEVCTFVPCSALRECEGFFVIFQNATTGECSKPKQA